MVLSRRKLSLVTFFEMELLIITYGQAFWYIRDSSAVKRLRCVNDVCIYDAVGVTSF